MNMNMTLSVLQQQRSSNHGLEIALRRALFGMLAQRRLSGILKAFAKLSAMAKCSSSASYSERFSSLAVLVMQIFLFAQWFL